jgi:MoaA/NifB/PqqE/SkfB family radical SAM enzyme
MCDRVKYVKNGGLCQELNIDSWSKIIKQLKDINIESVCITGGEPLLYDGIKELMSEVCNELPDADIDLISNGELLNKDFVNFFKNLSKRISFNLSMDGYKDVHNKIRRHDSYDRIRELAGEINNSKCFMRINSVIRNENIDSLIDLIKDSKLWSKYITLQHQSFVFEQSKQFLCGSLIPAKTSFDYLPVNPLTKESVEKLKILIPHVIGAYNDFFRFVPLISQDVVDDYYFNYSHQTPRKHCRHLTDSIRIKPDGSVNVCGWIHEQIGDLKEDTIEKIWKSEKINKFREFINADNVDLCKRCCGLWN